ncbi:Cytochrome P450 704C1 [Camellia lanceoleosa]|uniref:Cytochrome P450 704C1 n=1 Tax=Camellia lanceoleosa TaxID=1840588 RepID=A0ACC0H2Y4_9ERIC|nr:Cytochrome P450 704C1 [Camellia lanceoleosa]
MTPMDFLPNPMSLIVATAAIILVICSTKFVAGKLLEKRKRNPPIAGTVFNQLVNFHRLHDYFADLATKHRTYRLLDLFRSQIHTCDPANVEYILKTNFANYGKGWYHQSVLTDLLGDGIFTVDGDKWRLQRKLSSNVFSTKMLREFSTDVFRSNASKLAQIVSEAATSNQPIEVQDLFMKSSLDSVFKVILGVDLDSVLGTNEEGTRFATAFDEASVTTLYRYFDISWKIKRFLNIGSEAKLSDNVKLIDRFVYKLIKTKTEQVSRPQDDSTMKNSDILSRFLELNESDPKYLKDIILSFIIAGKDTTASTLSWFLYMMCKYPVVQSKIAREVWEATKLGVESSFGELVASVNEEALDKMQYLHAVLTETLRLYPAIPVEGRLCFSDDTLPDGFYVRKGDLVSFQPYAMGRLKWIWGDDADDFRPERWLDEKGVFQQESPFKFTAFLAGPRICLGREFAYRQMKIFLAVLIGSYEFKLSDDHKAVNYRIMLTLHIDGGLHLQASHRLRHT